VAATPEGKAARKNVLWRNLTWSVIGGHSRQAALLIVYSYLLSVLSADVFGFLTLAFSYSMIFVAIADAGLRQVGWRRIAENPSRMNEIVSDVMTMRVGTGIVALVLYSMLAWGICRTNFQFTVFMLYGITLFANCTTFDFAFLSFNRHNYIGKCSLLIYGLYVVICLLFVRSDEQAWIVPVAFVATMILFNMLLVGQYLREGNQLSLTYSREKFVDLGKESWPLGISFLIVRLTTNYPIILVGFFLTEAEITAYRTPELFYAFFAQFGIFLGTSAFTLLVSKASTEANPPVATIVKHLQTIALATIPCALLFAGVLPSALSWLWKDFSEETVVVTYWLAATTPLGVMTRYLKTCMPALGLSWELLLVSLVSIAVGVLGGCLMISEWGVIGMPLAVFLAEIVCLVMQIYYLAKKSPEMKLLELLKSWLATCSGLAACYFSAALLGFGDPQRAVLAVLVFAVGLAVRIRQNWLPKARVLMQQAKVAS
jgi:O-antigen/teichoic acid export membrane protein